MDVDQMKSIFKLYGEEYKNILGMMYPAKNSTGFPERNLTVNFARAYEKIVQSHGQCCCAWYEFQFGDKNNLHVDAVILNPNAGELLIIESKRFSNPPKKIKEVKEDIIRIPMLINELKQENRINMSLINTFYGVILADVWDETSPKKAILDSYKTGMKDYKSNDSFANKYLDNQIDKKIFYDVQDFKNLIDTYYLVSMVWEV